MILANHSALVYLAQHLAMAPDSSSLLMQALGGTVMGQVLTL